MRKSVVVLMVSIAVPGLLIATGALAQGQGQGQPQVEAQPKGQPGLQVATDEEKAVNSLEQAQMAAHKGDMNRAAQDLQRASAELRREAAGSNQQGKKVLERSARDLDKAAAEATKSQGEDSAKVNKKVAEVEHNLAKYHLDQSRASWTRKATEETGHELRLATRHLENGAKWAGVEAKAGARDVVGEAQEVSGKLIEGTQAIPKDVGRALDEVGTEIDKLGKKVKSSK